MYNNSSENISISNSIVGTKKFMNLNLNSQALYFHLIFNSNNKGIVNNYKSICRYLKINISYLDCLINNNFISYVDSCNIKINKYYRHKLENENSIYRKTTEYIKARNKTLKRDNFNCVKCKSKDNLHVHHIKSFSKYKNLRLDLNNLITLCKDCHIKIHSKGGNKNV